MKRFLNRRFRLLLVVLAGALVLSACDFNVYKLPLPGGPDTGDNPMQVTVKFRDVLDLVPKSTVKVDDVSVGQVTDITLEDYTAVVTLKLRSDVDLPADSIAQIRQTSLLGEKFVSLDSPVGGGQGRLADGDTIPLDRTGRNPEIEEVFSALSLLLNGGGVAQLKTIVGELNKTLDGREGTARSVLTQIDTLVGTLDTNKGDIITAIAALNRLSLSVRRQQGSIDAALEQLPSSLDSLNRQRDDLVKMLTALDNLSDVGVKVIKRSKADTIESLRLLKPILTQLANSGDNFVKSFNVSLTFPFVDDVVGRDPQVARNLHTGDYSNLDARLDLNLLDLPGLPGLPDLPDLPDLPEIPCTPLDAIPTGPLPPLSTLCQGAQDAINKCVKKPSLKNCDDLPNLVVDTVCKAIPIPGLCPKGGNGNGGQGTGPLGGLGDILPNLPGAGGLGGNNNNGNNNGRNGGRGGQGGGGGGGGGNGGGLLGGLGGLLGRPAFGAPLTENGPVTMRGLSQTFDPALVQLLTPGMVLQ